MKNFQTELPGEVMSRLSKRELYSANESLSNVECILFSMDT